MAVLIVSVEDGLVKFTDSGDDTILAPSLAVVCAKPIAKEAVIANARVTVKGH